MGLILALKKKFGFIFRLFFRKDKVRIGIYGPPNAGKTTLANRILRDWTGDIIGPPSDIPHETRRARLREGVKLEVDGKTLKIDIVDTPGLATKIDFHDFLCYGLSEEEAKRRAKEATEGVLLVMDSTEDPFTQVNITIVGNIEARKLPLLIVANKIDLPNAYPSRIKSAFPQHQVVAISALKGINIESLYKAMAEKFG